MFYIFLDRTIPPVIRRVTKVQYQISKEIFMARKEYKSRKFQGNIFPYQQEKGSDAYYYLKPQIIDSPLLFLKIIWKTVYLTWVN